MTPQFRGVRASDSGRRSWCPASLPRSNKMNSKLLIAGAVTGFLGALVTDINAWSRSGDAFIWSLAVKRWIAGAVSGALGAAGLSGLS